MLKIHYTGDPLLFDQKFEEDLDRFTNFKSSYSNLYDTGLRFKKQLSEGLQGFVGLVEKPYEEEGEEDEDKIINITDDLVQRMQDVKQYVFKMSQYIDFGVDHEYLVMEDLNKIREFCPHFVKVFGKTKVPVHESYRTTENPFIKDQDTKRFYDTSILFMEMVEGRKFYRYIKSKKVSVDHCMSIVKQTLMAVAIASEKVKFTHYDLHSNNVLVKKIPANSVFLYNFDEYRKYLVPTYGYCSTIIDFGFSYSKNCDRHPMYAPLAHTKYGFVPSRQNKYTDAKLFLTSVSYEMSKYKSDRKTNRSHKDDPSPKADCNRFRELILNVYQDLPVDLKCGQDENQLKSISTLLVNKLKTVFRKSAFFYHQGNYIVDLIQTLIELPLKKSATSESESERSDKLCDLFSYIIDEFRLIEKDTTVGTLALSSERGILSEGTVDMNNMYILKSMIQSANNNRHSYANKSTRSKAVEMFKNDVLVAVDQVVSFSTPNINWEKLLCTLLCCGKCIENQVYEWMKEYIAVKNNDYDQLKIKTTHELFEYLDANIPSPFEFDSNTTIYVWDIEQETNFSAILPESMIEKINSVDPYDRGHYLYNYIIENRE